ncbi:transglutaminase-like domain-containing protein [Sphingomonas kyungheensis]|uniref:Transglutaminase-like domain-containing protein n=1 Tax=Sphingomonas kyungheensis TaxID=1069987 RepID=A0ABU8H4S5_9SPHN
MSDDLLRLGLLDDEDIVLDHAALALALLDHAEGDDDPARAVIDAVADRLDELAPVARDAQTQAEILAQVFADEFGFSGDSDSYDDPANADLIQVIARRRGLPVSLSILYVAAARRLGWSAHVLDVPGHVLVLIGGEAAPVMIDPFRDGRFVDAAELAAMVQGVAGGRAPAVSHVAAMPNRAVLVRLLLNQATRAEAAGAARRALILYRRMTVVAPDYGHGWWERARLELADGDVTTARSSLAAMLEITRDTALRARIATLLASLAAV